MHTTAINWGCGLIATAPVFAAHTVFTKEIRYILLSWFCSFVSTVLLVICSLSSLFTKDPYFILLFSIPFDVLGKVLLKFFACKFEFLKSPRARISLGLSCGNGFALAHVLTLYLPIVFDQPYSVDFTSDHPDYFPNCLDLALLNHGMSVAHMAFGLILFRFAKMNEFVMFCILFTLQYGMAALTRIPYLWVKNLVLFIIAYGLLIFGLISFRSMDYTPIKNNIPSDEDEEEEESEPKKRIDYSD
ncbi:hypothetical protein TRFO_24095 [Tritrichomonas foetus]|uniref:Transmembrane protein n=1 Tax=Tritrichomonas foetus TaxID=1144522 RepID=A0A1J4K8Y3_9EUKA|nr:hypothetical protein TRFO_24095 [Tritrichomonas foetus]|eukprot:OHT07675.1 hypothetical protein TRFO_24095 [Tritrichomonas foetus]